MTAASTSITRYRFPVLMSFVVATGAGCEAPESAEPAVRLARPVSYIALKETRPTPQTQITGSIESWKKEMVGFQVGGRVRFVREPGVNVKGPVMDGSGNVLEPGTLLAVLKDERYQLNQGEAEARVAQMQAQARATQIDIDETIPNELREVQAEHERTRKEYQRQRSLLDQGFVARRAVDNARAAFKEAQARVAQVRGRLDEKRAQLAGIQAQIQAARDAARLAGVDVADTKLTAPFSGQISKVHVIPGGYVEPGQPVATVQMMDPVKVEIAVSPEVDQRINYNDVMKVHLDGVKEPLEGWVWHKDTVANASTRTFTVTLLIRNRQEEVALSPGLEDGNIATTRSLWNLESEHDDERAPFFTNEDTLHRDDAGYFVWKIEGLTVADLEHDFSPVFRVTKVRVQPGHRHLRFLQILSYRELQDLGGLNPKTDLLAGQLPDSVQDGDSVFLSRKRWVLRPGQLARVSLRDDRRPEAFYVPASAIIKRDSKHHVYVVEGASDGQQRATKVDVRLGAAAGTLQAIEAIADGGLGEGMKLVIGGAHYIHDGDPINAFTQLAELSQ